MLLLLVVLTAGTAVEAWQQPLQSSSSIATTTRRELLLQHATATAATAAAVMATATMTAFSNPRPAMAAENDPTKDKLVNLSDAELKQKILSDITEKQFLVTGNISRELYEETATFQDEIDTYGLEQWVKGTSNLFVASKSHVDLEENTLTVTQRNVTFRFSEYLCFNVPLLLPTVYLSGMVTLERSPTTGLITSYKEQWDQDVNTVLKSAKLFS
jgi:hypothetical protein